MDYFAYDAIDVNPEPPNMWQSQHAYMRELEKRWLGETIAERARQQYLEAQRVQAEKAQQRYNEAFFSTCCVRGNLNPG
jgi:hypothetical protein